MYTHTYTHKHIQKKFNTTKRRNKNKILYIHTSSYIKKSINIYIHNLNLKNYYLKFQQSKLIPSTIGNTFTSYKGNNFKTDKKICLYIQSELYIHTT